MLRASRSRSSTSPRSRPATSPRSRSWRARAAPPGPGGARRQARLHAGLAAGRAATDDPRAGERAVRSSTGHHQPATSPSTAAPPFDDPLVREAVNPPSTTPALARLRRRTPGGCALLAPGVPGYDETLDPGECPYGDPSGPPDLPPARADRAGGRAVLGSGWRRGTDADAGSPAPMRDPGPDRPRREAGAAQGAQPYRIEDPAARPPRAFGFLPRRPGSTIP